MVQNEIRHRARLIVDSDDVPPVEGNAQRLEQVFLNLLVNATQALPDGRAEQRDPRRCCHRLGDDQVVVEVRDNGPGIAPEVLPRIFDPFFTTKTVGVGMGLGLSICHGIVTAHGGSITVDAHRAGGGACFRVTLPVTKPVAADARPAAAGGRCRRRTGLARPPAGAGGRRRARAGRDHRGACSRHDYQVEVVTDAREALQAPAGRSRPTTWCCAT